MIAIVLYCLLAYFTEFPNIEIGIFCIIVALAEILYHIKQTQSSLSTVFAYCVDILAESREIRELLNKTCEKDVQYQEIVNNNANENWEAEKNIFSLLQNEQFQDVLDLLEDDISPNIQDSENYPLVTRVINKMIDRDKWLLDILRKMKEKGCDVSKMNYLFQFAIRNNLSEATSILMDMGADINCVISHHRVLNDGDYFDQEETPLTEAIKAGNVNIVWELCHLGADVNRTVEYFDVLGYSYSTPLELAIKSKNIKILEIILSKNVTLTKANYDGGTYSLYSIKEEIEEQTEIGLLFQKYIEEKNIDVTKLEE